MKERAILFSAPMVRAILAGHKMQTRRVMRPQPPAGWFAESPDDTREDGEPYDITPRWLVERCPHGKPGDRLWVRETWTHDADSIEDARAQHEDAVSLSPVYYRAGMPDDEAGTFSRWWPSIHMPRWASRITLEITEVRVQRLQEIGEDDARAEGVEPLVMTRKAYPSKHAADVERRSYRPGFARLWGDINGKRAPWSSNPWVWALTFRRLA